MSVKIYDTLSQKKLLVNLHYVGIYICGVTPYADSHIGHGRTIITFDILRRYLETANVKVKIIQNFTDVDDKIIKVSKDENLTIDKITNKFINHYYHDFDLLNAKRADMYPKATEHINDIINFITKLLQKNIAYITISGIYFSIVKFHQYGKLSKKNINELVSGARVLPDENKSKPYDFALWKFSNVYPVWNSPWGKGRPGWHIECSVMSTKYLGANFEIHGGGRDLIFPHHENEIAQYESCTNNQLAKIWMHVGVIKIKNDKMSKSKHNVKFLYEILKEYDANIIRLFYISTHYSKPINYTNNLLNVAKTKWIKIKTCYYELISSQNTNINEAKKTIDLIDSHKKKFHEYMNDDLNTVNALALFLEFIKQLNVYLNQNQLTQTDIDKSITEIQNICNVFGLRLPIIALKEKNLINSLIKKRELLREQKRYYEADKIRKQIEKMNVILLDHPNRTTWIKK
ncbi:MAG: cysteine--tRNA ligase [Thaumarchaeota archaeon]|nr:cysteine--tRNA ligase [Nitrososphaerota archaeon]